MSVIAIGDVQGCFAALQNLLKKVGYNSDRDVLWFVGDLINRGPDSLAVLEFVKGLGDGAVSVLGNHELHFMAIAHGVRPHGKKDTLLPILESPRLTELIDWLRCRPLLHHDEKLGFTMVHAGLSPAWNLAQAQKCAKEVETLLRSENYINLLKNMYGDLPDLWDPALTGWERIRVVINCFTRIRFVNDSGRYQLAEKGDPASHAGLIPWFKYPGRQNKAMSIIFGHWSALGFHQEQGICALDTGCIWGGVLTAVLLEDHQRIVKVVTSD